MALNYHLVTRKVLRGTEKGKKKYFAQVRAGEVKDLDSLCVSIAESSSATRGDVALVLHGMVSCLTEYIKEGNIVQMGELGNFRLSAGSEGVEREEDFTMNLMRNPKILFTPGKILRRLRNKIQFNRVELKTVIKIIPCDLEHP